MQENSAERHPNEQWIQELQRGGVERRFHKPHPIDFLPNIGLFGTVGGSEWRKNVNGYFALLCQEFGFPFDEHVLFNPEVTDHPWGMEDRAREVVHMSKDAVVLYTVEAKVSSIGSMAELGFTAAQSLLTGRKSIAYIMQANPEFGENVVRARSLSIIDARYINSLIPNHFLIHPNLRIAAMEAFQRRAEFLAALASPVLQDTVHHLRDRNDIQRIICLSGTSKTPNSPERLGIIRFFQENGLAQSYFDTVRSDWSYELYEQWEMPAKDKSLVNLVLITDTTSYGALKDIGIATFRAIVSGTYAIIFVPDDSDPKSAYTRAKNLVIGHFETLVKDHPWVSHYVKFVSTPEEMGKLAQTILTQRKF